MRRVGDALEGVEWGNAWDLRDPCQPHTNGLVGDHPGIPRSALRVLRHGETADGERCDDGRPEAPDLVSNRCLKGFQHHPDDDPAWGAAKPTSQGRTLSLLAAAGPFALSFGRDGRRLDLVLERAGDVALWGEGLEHSWRVLAPSTVLTVRWRLLDP